MSDHPNAQTLRGFYACFENEGYATRVKAFLAPWVVWHVAGDNPLAGEFQGREAVADQMRRYEQHSRGTLRLDTAIMATGVHAVAIHTATGSLPGFSYHAHEIDVFHVEDGLISEFWSFSEDQAATDRMWS